jgi:hypothetical protein
LDPKTKRKLTWISGSKEELREKFATWISPQQLDINFGGDSEIK